MNFKLIFLIAVVLFSCSNKTPKDTLLQESIEILKESKVDSNQTTATHIIDVKCDGEFIPIRSEILTKSELELSQEASAAAKAMNDSVIIERLYNGSWVKLIKADTLGYNYVQVIDQVNRNESVEQRNIRGFIISKYCGETTLKKLERVNMPSIEDIGQESKDKIDFLKYHNPTGDMLDYAYTYISPQADYIQVLTFSITGVDEIQFKFYLVINQNSHFMFDGYALIEKVISDENGLEQVSFATYNPIGQFDFNLHLINNDSHHAFITFNDESEYSIFPVPEEWLTEKMDRIK